MGKTLELGRFVVEPDEEQQFLAKREAMVKAAKDNFPGLIDLKLAKLDDGSYVDVVFWEDRSCVKTAIAKAETIPAVAEWLQHVSEDLSMDFGKVVDADQN